MQLGRNVEVSIKANKLIITIDLKQKGVPSKSGKSIVLATTLGNKFIPDAGVNLGLNVYKPLQQ